MIKYKEGYKYQLHETYAIKTGIEGFSCKTDFLHLFVDGTLVMYKGYAWDGATGIYDFEFVIRGSLVHDALYQLIRLGLLPENMKKKADILFSEICKESAMRMYKDGMLPKEVLDVFFSIIKYGLYKGVEWFGGYGLGPEKEIKEAP